MRFLSCVALAICLVLVHAHVQQLECDVATIKVPAPIPFGTALDINLGTFRNETWTIADPNWIKSQENRFDVIAKAVSVFTRGCRADKKWHQAVVVVEKSEQIRTDN